MELALVGRLCSHLRQEAAISIREDCRGCVAPVRSDETEELHQVCEVSVSQKQLEGCWEQLALRPMVGQQRRHCLHVITHCYTQPVANCRIGLSGFDAVGVPGAGTRNAGAA